jgi:HEXXH motif-containing protein
MTYAPTYAIEPLGGETAGRIAAGLAARRLAFAGEAVATALRDGSQSDAALHAWAAGVARLLREDPARGRAILEHWSNEFLLSRSRAASGGTRRLTGDLACNLLGTALRGGTPALQGTFEVSIDRDGAVPSYRAEARIAVAPESRAAAVSIDVDAAHGKRLPFARALPWDLPIVPDDPAASLVPEALGSFVPAGRSGPSLAEELDAAGAILAALWPEANAWIALLCPAFIDLGAASRAETLSGSFGPGLPVYLSAAHDPFLLAENVVHELQHLRLGLSPMQEYATRWFDADARFVSPYRPDPRPLRGIHLGLHAFLAVNELRLRAAERGMGTNGSLRDAARAHRMNVFAYRTLSQYENFTPQGERYWDEIGATVAAQERALDRLSDRVAVRAADTWLERHLAIVRAAAPHLPNDDFALARLS